LFLDLLDHHGAALLSTLRRLCGNAHDADDVFQETAIRVWRFLPGRGGLRSPRAWLMTVAYRSFLDQQGRRCTHADLEDAPDASLPDPSEQAERSEQHGKVNDAVAELPEPIRAVLALHYTAGLTLRQTAKALGISLGTVKSRLNNGLARLRRLLS